MSPISQTAKLGTVAASFVLLSLLVVALNSSSVSAAPKPTDQSVIVTNTPLPVSGTVAIGNVPSVTIANTSLPVTGNVGISGPVTFSASSPLAVTNALDSGGNPIPLVVKNPALQPYQSGCLLNPPICGFQAVPLGKRLVIQEVDMQGEGSGFSAVLISTWLNGDATAHAFPVTNAGPGNGGSTFITHQSTTLYSDQNTSPVCSLYIFSGSVNPNPHAAPLCNISGYLIDTQ
jgi:hypothetical protein